MRVAVGEQAVPSAVLVDPGQEMRIQVGAEEVEDVLDELSGRIIVEGDQDEFGGEH